MLSKQGNILLAVAVSVIFLAWRSLVHPLPKLLWNGSANVPIGLYWTEIHRPSRSEIAVLKLPEWAALIASERLYLPCEAWLMKPVAASKNYLVCRFGAHVFVNEKRVAKALPIDKGFARCPRGEGAGG